MKVGLDKVGEQGRLFHSGPAGKGGHNPPPKGGGGMKKRGSGVENSGEGAKRPMPFLRGKEGAQAGSHCDYNLNFSPGGCQAKDCGGENWLSERYGA